MNKTIKMLLVFTSTITFLTSCGSKETEKAEIDQVISGETHYTSYEPVKRLDDEKDIIEEKLKQRAARDWPDDYITQEFWIDEQLDAYEYMLTIDDNSIKEKAQRDWPLDFVTQKFWYNEQVEAKERIN